MSNYTYSFSGSDFQAIAWISIYNRDFKIVTTPAVRLELLTTISISINQSKSPVRSLGKKGVSGYTSSIEQIAGTMIFNVVNKHPLFDLIDSYKTIYNDVGEWAYSRDYIDGSFDSLDPGKLANPTHLPPINIMLIGSTELDSYSDGSIYGSIPKEIHSVQTLLTGVELISNSTNISVNNILTEDIYGFVATGYQILREYSGASQMSKELQDSILQSYLDENSTINGVPVNNDLAIAQTCYELTTAKKGSNSFTNGII